MYDIQKIRADFPILSREVYGKPLVYLDNGATTQKPRCVVDAITDEYYSVNANVHRGVHFLSQQATELHEASRETVRKFINAGSINEIVFTRGTTESINLLAASFGEEFLSPGDEVIVSVMEHHSNIVPWQLLAERKRINLKVIPMNDRGELLMDEYEKLFNDRTKIVSVVHVSNVLGTVNPIKEMIKVAHNHNVPFLVDAAQSIPHMAVDVKELDADFLVFSGHKVYGPTGVGVLYGKYHLLEEMTPTRFGGGSNARYNSCGLVKLKNAPTKFESGTPNIEGVIGLGSAIEYLQKIGMKNIEEHEAMLRKYAVEKMKELDNIEIYNENGVGAIAFNIKNVFSQDGASLFNTYGIAIRAGQHCAKILDEYLHVSQTLRASFYFYNTKEEIDQFIEVCKKGDDFLDAFFG